MPSFSLSRITSSRFFKSSIYALISMGLGSQAAAANIIPDASSAATKSADVVLLNATGDKIAFVPDPGLKGATDLRLISSPASAAKDAKPHFMGGMIDPQGYLFFGVSNPVNGASSAYFTDQSLNGQPAGTATIVAAYQGSSTQHYALDKPLNALVRSIFNDISSAGRDLKPLGLVYRTVDNRRHTTITNVKYATNYVWAPESRFSGTHSAPTNTLTASAKSGDAQPVDKAAVSPWHVTHTRYGANGWLSSGLHGHHYSVVYTNRSGATAKAYVRLPAGRMTAHVQLFENNHKLSVNVSNFKSSGNPETSYAQFQNWLSTGGANELAQARSDIRSSTGFGPKVAYAARNIMVNYVTPTVQFSQTVVNKKPAITDIQPLKNPPQVIVPADQEKTAGGAINTPSPSASHTQPLKPETPKHNSWWNAHKTWFVDLTLGALPIAVAGFIASASRLATFLLVLATKPVNPDGSPNGPEILDPIPPRGTRKRTPWDKKNIFDAEFGETGLLPDFNIQATAYQLSAPSIASHAADVTGAVFTALPALPSGTIQNTGALTDGFDLGLGEMRKGDPFNTLDLSKDELSANLDDSVSDNGELPGSGSLLPDTNKAAAEADESDELDSPGEEERDEIPDPDMLAPPKVAEQPRAPAIPESAIDDKLRKSWRAARAQVTRRNKGSENNLPQALETMRQALPETFSTDADRILAVKAAAFILRHKIKMWTADPEIMSYIFDNVQVIRASNNASDAKFCQTMINLVYRNATGELREKVKALASKSVVRAAKRPSATAGQPKLYIVQQAA